MANQFSKPIPVRERFNKYVDKSGGPDACWPWTGSRRGPYGGFTVGSLKDGTKRRETAHRVAFMLQHGEVPDGKSVLHRCDNPPCVNPRHLYAGTALENAHDCITRNRRGKGYKKPNYVHRVGVHLGERNPRAKLTREQAVSAIKRRQAGESHASIARDFGVGASTIWATVSGQNWPELESLRKARAE